MSKQTTLFSTWRVSAPTSGKNWNNSTSGQSNRNTAKVCPDENLKLEFQDFDEFFEDDLKEAEILESYANDPHGTRNLTTSTSHAQQVKARSFHVGPSTSILNSSITEESIPGFNSVAGEVWIYPTNYPVRDYQFNIVQKSLFTNTLVCLPTGLGKTFIAAVVMYNFYSWYPNGKIVFLAPTKPLVAQQIEACYGVMGIPQDHAAEMTGNLPPRERILMWRDKRVFFLTPQVMQNDLNKGTCPAEDVCCVVFDEAHKALGNHSYCQVVKELTKAGGNFRVLALSATPGNDLKAVQQVVTNLQIGHIELRSEDSFDIQRFVHERRVEKIVVPLEGDILEIKNNFLSVLTKVIGRLASYRVLYHGNAERMSKYQLLSARDQFRSGPPPSGVTTGAVEGDFALAISLFHGYELLQLHGMRTFYQYLTSTFTSGGQQSRAKLEVLKSPLFGGIMQRLKEKLGTSNSTDGPGSIPNPHFPVSGSRAIGCDNVSSSTASFCYSHPKLEKLEKVVIKHFKDFSSEQSSSTANGGSVVNTRVMIFSQYRESVQEIADMLSRHSPLVRVMSFVGHGTSKSSSKGLTQKEQTEVVRKFRGGGYNTLVATCVGEEGLDIGEVDLIVCFDAAKSPIRLVQRMGRTGRKRNGKIVVIVAEGKEDQIYNKSQSNKKSIHRAIREGCKQLAFFKKCPRMVPRHIVPQVHKLHMTIGEFVSSKPSKRGAKKPTSGLNQSNLAFGTCKKKKKPTNAYLNCEELRCWSNELALSDREFKAVERSVNRCLSVSPFMSVSKLSGGGEGSHSVSNVSILSPNTTLNSSTSQLNKTFSLSLEKWTHFQTAPIPTKIVGHSLKSQQLTSTLEFIDLTHTSDEVGLNYDQEMQTFLKLGDVKIRSRDKECRRSNEVIQKCKSDEQIGLKATGKRRQVIDDLSDDEDFEAPQCTSSGPYKKHKSTSPVSAGSTTCSDDDVQIIEEPSVSSPLQPDAHCDATEMDQFVDLTASQHVVPRAPSPDSLDWLDSLNPSQVSTPCVPKATSINVIKSALKSSKTTSPTLKKSVDFEFVTPKAPLSKTFQSSSPKSSHHVSSVRSPLDSIDLFQDLSANVLFGDFSTEENVARRSVVTTPLATEKQPTSKCTSGGQCTEQFIDLCDVQDVFKHDENIDTIEESDFEDNFDDIRTPTLDCSSPSIHPAMTTPNKVTMSSSISTDDSFIRVHGKGRKRRSANKFQSPTHSETQATKYDFSPDSSDEEFAKPLLKRVGKPKNVRKKSKTITSSVRTAPTSLRGALIGKETNGYVEEEAEVSSDEHMYYTDGDHVCSGNEYDFQDSFINDNSMLTQVSPTQRVRFNEPKSTKMAKGTGNMYLQSLMSPGDRLFANKRKGKRGRFRMVLSQRHCILNHYINKAGFKVDDSGKRQRSKKKRTTLKTNDSVINDQHLFSTESSGSEAEEVWHDEEEVWQDDFEELPPTLHEEQDSWEDGHDGEVAVTKSKIGKRRNRKRRVNFLSDSDHDASHHEDKESASFNCGQLKKPRVSSSPVEVNRNKFTDRPQLLRAPVSEVVISPSLLANITIKRTPPCFSLGMDDWLTDIDYDYSMKNEGVYPVNQPVNNEPIEILSQKDLEDFEAGFSDTELM